MVHTVITILSLATIAGQVLFVALLTYLLWPKSVPAFIVRLGEWATAHATECGFVMALIGTCGSLFFSNIAGYTPCTLCWFERIFYYPQTILFAVAQWWKARDIERYSLPLSWTGGVIALYHLYIQYGGESPLPCSAVGQSISCSKIFVRNFGYITIPMMALTGFALMIVLMYLAKKKSA